MSNYNSGKQKNKIKNNRTNKRQTASLSHRKSRTILYTRILHCYYLAILSCVLYDMPLSSMHFNGRCIFNFESFFYYYCCCCCRIVLNGNLFNGIEFLYKHTHRLNPRTKCRVQQFSFSLISLQKTKNLFTFRCFFFFFVFFVTNYCYHTLAL